jgi:hypothetical protein
LQHENNTLENQVEITQHITNYFQNLFTETPIAEYNTFNPSKTIPLDNEHNQHIMDEITGQEILIAIKQSASKKSPGPDGLTREFYLKSWSIIKSEMVHIMNESLNGQFDKTFMGGAIVLVKKKTSDDTIKSFRPISLLNCNYKLFTRILKLRMDDLMPLIINNNQTSCNTNKNITSALCKIVKYATKLQN